MKKCSKCGRILDESKFFRISKTNNNLRSWCKDCCCEYARIYTEKKKIAQGEEIIAKTITNNKVKDLFDIKNLKDIPAKLRKTLNIPKKLLIEKQSSFIIKSQITNVLRRSQNSILHCSQIAVAYYRMYGEILSNKSLSKYLTSMKKHDQRISNPSKGYYLYKMGE